ncbi:MAG: carbohydrate ABC transporter permease [Microcoleaceae cyanobacterium]
MKIIFPSSNNQQQYQQPLGKNIFIYILLLIIAVVMLFPLLWLLSTAFKSSGENIFQFPPQFIPSQPTLENFIKVWQSHPFAQYLWNSTIIAGLTVIGNLLFSSLAAYPLARLNFTGRDVIFAIIIATIMIPFQIVMIPLYVLTIKLGLKNSYFGVIFPSLASAFGIFLIRQALRGIPQELEDAARIDGCNDWQIWWLIMLPLIKPALVTLSIFTFIGSWSDFLWPLLILDRPEYYTLPLGLANLAGAFSLDWRLVAAGSIIATAPVLIIFLILQKYIVATDSATGIKG